MERNPDKFVTFLQQRAGQSLRAVRFYSETNQRSVYARDDVQQEISQTDIEQIVSQARRELMERADDQWQFTHGEMEATVRIFQNAVIINLLSSGNFGVLLSLDAEIASRLHSFIYDCQSWLSDE
ncbi:DUF7522 family protein [Halorussus salinisoli]